MEVEKYTNAREMLQVAHQNHYAVPAFNVSNQDDAEIIIKIANELKLPVILAITKKYVVNEGMESAFSIVKIVRRTETIPITLHLDHFENIDDIQKLLTIGFNSCMIDGSQYPFERNVEITREVVGMASHYNASVEGSLGILGGQDSGVIGGQPLYTDPFSALDFVKRTGVDSLAVAIGNTHGFSEENNLINVKRFSEIGQVVKIPLVLHGASGLSNITIQRLIESGCAKVNYDLGESLTTFCVKEKMEMCMTIEKS